MTVNHLIASELVTFKSHETKAIAEGFTADEARQIALSAVYARRSSTNTPWPRKEKAA